MPSAATEGGTVSVTHRPLAGRLLIGLGAMAAVAISACGSSPAPPSSSGGAQQSAAATSAPAGSGTTSIIVSGTVSGALSSPGAACVDEGQAGFQVAIQGKLGGTGYVLKFNAPSGTTDFSVKTTADIVVGFFQLPAGASWGADPRSSKGSGTIQVNGPAGGKVDLHNMVPSAGTPATGTIDVVGSYACTSNIAA